MMTPDEAPQRRVPASACALFGLQDATFVVAGAASPHYDPRAMACAHGLEPVTHWLGYVGAATFETVLTAADLCVNLRSPPRSAAAPAPSPPVIAP